MEKFNENLNQLLNIIVKLKNQIDSRPTLNLKKVKITVCNAPSPVPPEATPML